MFHLALNVATIVGNNLVAPDLNISQGSQHHVRVQGCHLPLNVSLELIQGGRTRRVHPGLQITPEEKVQWFKIWTDELHGHHAISKLMVQVPHVGECAVRGSSVLGPDKSVNFE